jgi:hypothetical protein
MSLSTVLLTVQSLLDRDPALHEPGVKSNPAYATYVQHQSIALTLRLIDETKKGAVPPLLRGFEEPWRTRIPNILSSYVSLLTGKSEEVLGDLMYGMRANRTQWGELLAVAGRLI